MISHRCYVFFNGERVRVPGIRTGMLFYFHYVFCSKKYSNRKGRKENTTQSALRMVTCNGRLCLTLHRSFHLDEHLLSFCYQALRVIVSIAPGSCFIQGLAETCRGKIMC